MHKLTTFMGKRNRVGHSHEPDSVWQADQVLAKRKALYDNGTPFFTKASLQDIHRQLKGDLQPGHKITVKSFDGEVVEYDVEIGQVNGLIKAHPDPDVEYVAAKPRIRYMSHSLVLGHLKGIGKSLSPLMISHGIAPRHKDTKEFVQDEFPSGLETVKAGFTKALTEWETSKTCLEVQATLNSMKYLRALKIDKIIAFALGSISLASYDNPLDSRVEKGIQRSSYQYGLVITLRKILHDLRGCQNIQCFAQDPALTTIDSEVLKMAEIHTLDDPEGFLRVDDTTLVISIAANVPVKEIIAETTRPAMILWDYSPERDPWASCTDPSSPRVGTFLKTYYSQNDILCDKEYFTPLAMYTRLEI